ncbi:MAG TPA: hypothetical protein VNS58_12420 [Puia sp.]|nr:hypothetical protein [Puia sp.]
MKLLALGLLILPLIGFTQSLKTINDEYSKVLITSWEPIIKGLTANMIVHVQCTRTNSDLELGFKLMWVKGAVDEGAELQLTMDNDSIVTLNNSRFTLPCVGCGSIGFFGSGDLGFYLRFSIPSRAANELSTRKIKKLRLYMHDGYIEDNVKAKFSDIIQKELRLL